MRRQLLVLFGCLSVVLSASLVPAQDSSHAAPAPRINVILGHSAIALDGPWRFQVGDNPQWSDPAFDDSAWETTSVGTPVDSYDPNMGSAGFVPGWTGKGHPGYSGFAWYRARVHLGGATGSLALLAPYNVDDSYQLFVNGHLLGSFGDFNRGVPSVYVTRPRVFRIPASILRPDGAMDIAFRFYMAPRELLQIDPGGMHGPPYLGFTDALVPVYHVQLEQGFRTTASVMATSLIFLVFALLIFMLFAFDRTERILLLPLAACLLSGIYLLLITAANVTSLLTATAQAYAGAFIIPAFRGLWALTWWAYFGLQSKKWIRNFIFIVAAFSAITTCIFFWVTSNSLSVPHSVFTTSTVMGDLGSAAMVILIVLIAWFGIRKAQKIDWMLLLATIFYVIPNLTPIFHALHVRTDWFPFGIDLQLILLSSLASLFCFSIVLLRRFRVSQRRQQAVIEDVKQAQQVQQILIPEELPQLPGFTVESEYRPAREVGGDFFQIIPYPSDDSVLIVAGDVTGKGLPAGMLVALIVGTIRAEAAHSSDPLAILNSLNARLCGRNNANATCLALHLDAHGDATLANAGHLPPYLNGKEIAVDGALPLGIALKADFSLTRFQLQPNDRLILLSDGIAEAQDGQGQLFGFDRIRDLLARPISVAGIATAAQNFGQQDDISVLAITRTVVREHAVA